MTKRKKKGSKSITLAQFKKEVEKLETRITVLEANSNNYERRTADLEKRVTALETHGELSVAINLRPYYGRLAMLFEKIYEMQPAIVMRPIAVSPL